MPDGYEIARAFVVLDAETPGTAKILAADQAFNRMGTSAGVAGKKVGVLGSIAQQQQRNLSALGTVAKTAGIAGFGALTYAIVDTVRAGVDYEKQMSRVQAVSGATGKQMQSLNRLAKQLGADTKFSASEAAGGMYELSSAGFKVGEMSKAIRGTLDLAAASNIDLAAASEISANALRGFGLEADRSRHVADVLAKVVNASSVEMTDLQLSLKYIGPVAKATGQNFETMIAAVGEMGNAGIKGEQAGTTLRGALLNLIHPVGQTEKGLSALGLAAEDLQGKKGLLPLPKIIAVLEDRMKGMTKAQQSATLAQIFGKEAASGMFAVIDAGPEKLRKLTQGLKDSDGAAKDAAKTMQDNVAGAWEQFTGSLETTQISLFQKFESPIKDAIDGATRYVNQKGPELTKAIGDIVKTPEFKKADLQGQIAILAKAAEDPLIDAFNEILPEIAEAGGEAGFTFIKAMGHAFFESNALGKLFIAGTFVRYLGGWGLFTKLGGSIGGRIGTSIGTKIGPGIMGAFSGIGGLGLGAVIAAGIEGLSEDNKINAAIDKLNKLAEKPSNAFSQMFRLNPNIDTANLERAIEDYTALGKISEKSIWKWVEAGKITAEQGQRMITVLDAVNKRGGKALIGLSKDLKGAAKSAKGFTDAASDALRDWSKGSDKQIDNVVDALKGPLEKAFEDATDEVKDFTGDASDRLKDFAKDADKNLDKSGKSLDDFGKKTAKVKRQVGANFLGLASVVKTGLGNIIENTNKALKGFGVKRVAISLAGVGSAAAGVGRHQTGGIARVPGTGSGDIVPDVVPHGTGIINRKAAQVLLEPGEVKVSPREVQRMGGPQAIHAINRAIPRHGGRFNKGGVASGGLDFALGPYAVSPITYAADHAGGNSHVHITGTTTPWVVAIGKQLQRMGNIVSEHPAFGGVNAQHSATGGHYDALAIDVNDPSGNEPRSWVASIARILGGNGIAGAVAEKIAREILKGPDGPLKDTGQGALDKVRDAANKFIASQSPKGVDPGYTSIEAGGSVVAQMGKILLANNFSRAGAAGIIGNAYRESLWDPSSVGTGGGGLFGFTTSPVSLADLQNFASREGTSWANVATQMQFMLANPGGGGLMSDSYYNGLEGFLKSTNNVHDATYRFMNEWERPGVPAFEDRLAGAQKAFAMKGWQKGGIVGRYGNGGVTRGHGHVGDLNSPDYIEGTVSTGKPTLEKLLNRIKAKEKAVAILDENIARNNTLFGLAGSLSGSDLDPIEAKDLIGSNQTLLEKLMGERDIVEDALGLTGKQSKGLSRRINHGSIKGLQHRREQVAKLRKQLHGIDGKGLSGLREQLHAAKSDKERAAIQHKIDKQEKANADERERIEQRIGKQQKAIADLKDERSKRQSRLTQKLERVQGRTENLKSLLEELEGVTGKGGRIFDTQIEIANLLSTGSGSGGSGSSGMDISQLRSVIEAARFGVFDNAFAGPFGKGGSIPAGMWGIAGETGKPEIVEGPARVFSPAQSAQMMGGAAPIIYADIYIGGEKIDERVEVKVRGLSRQDDREMHLAGRQYRP